MDKIIVTRRDNTTYSLHNRSARVTEAALVRSLLEDDYVQVGVESSSARPFAIGDHITVHGRKYTLNQLPSYEKSGSRAFRYTLRFEGVQYDLGRVAFLLNSDTAGNLQDVSGDTFIGDIKAFLDILVANANRVFGAGSWVVGDYPSGTSADTQLTFGPDDNCLSVLQTLCDTFGCEFSITTTNGVSTINMGTVGSTFPYALAYGRHHGLYELTRENCDGDNVVTRMYVYGGTKNLPPFYPCDRLLLRGTTYTITKRNSMLESATMQGRYGVFECVKIYDDVFPEREGEVTAVVQADVLKFTDSTMFDLNAKWADNTTDYNYYLSLSGRTDSTEVHNNYTANVVGTSKYLINGGATVHFNSGGLAGYEFTVTAYDHTTHTFTIEKVTDDRGREFPDATDGAFQISVGDKYTLLNIMLPNSYITTAQQRLMAKAQDDFDTLCSPKVRYNLKADGQFLRSASPNEPEPIRPGDTVTLADGDTVASSTSIRVRTVETDLLTGDADVRLEDSNIFKAKRLSNMRDMVASKEEAYAAMQRISDPAAVYIPTVGSDGTISWNNNAGLQNPVSRNIKGPAGTTFTPSISGDVLSFTNNGNLPNPTPVKVTQKADVLSSSIQETTEVRIGDTEEEYMEAVNIIHGDGWNCNLYEISDDLTVYVGGNMESGKRLEIVLTNIDERDHTVTVTNGRLSQKVLSTDGTQFTIASGCSVLLRTRWCIPEGYDESFGDNSEIDPVVLIETITLQDIEA